MFAVCLALAACGRPLTGTERRFAATVQGDALAVDRVRVTDTALLSAFSMERPARPRTACQDRILPPPDGPVVSVSPGALVLFDRVYYDRSLYRRDFLQSYPEQMSLWHAMLLAHELTHVWQWQNREKTGYSPFKAAGEHDPGADPYLFELDGRGFLDFGYEQQGAVVEEYVCCRALDPEGERTQRLYDLLRPHFPDIARQETVARAGVVLPWDGAETRGICS